MVNKMNSIIKVLVLVMYFIYSNIYFYSFVVVVVIEIVIDDISCVVIIICGVVVIVFCDGCNKKKILIFYKYFWKFLNLKEIIFNLLFFMILKI